MAILNSVKQAEIITAKITILYYLGKKANTANISLFGTSTLWKNYGGTSVVLGPHTTIANIVIQILHYSRNLKDRNIFKRL